MDGTRESRSLATGKMYTISGYLHFVSSTSICLEQDSEVSTSFSPGTYARLPTPFDIEQRQFCFFYSHQFSPDVVLHAALSSG